MLREDKLIFNNKEYVIRIYVERRRSVYMSIGKKVNIRVPRFFFESKREEQIKKMKDKFVSYLEKNEEKFAPISSRAYSSGEVFSIYGREYLLTIIKEARKTSLARLKDNEIIFKMPLNLKDEKEVVSKLLNKILSKDLLPLLKERVDYFNNLHFKKEIKSISLKNNTSKFGSCSHDHKLVFSTSLLLAPSDVIDYVIVHELAHTVHLNHSKRFWKVVEKFFPNYKEKSKWLRENRAKLII